MLALGKIAELDARGGVVRRINHGNGSIGDVLPIQHHSVHLRGAEIHKRGAGLRGKANSGRGGERGDGSVSALAKIQLNAVMHVGNEASALCCLAVVQVC